MTLIECYLALEGDYESVLSRMMTEKLVARFIIKFLDDDSFSNLAKSMKEADYDEAFRAAHTLKGICQNLSFDKLLGSAVSITEALRNKNTDEALLLFPQVETDYVQTVSAIKEFMRSAS